MADPFVSDTRSVVSGQSSQGRGQRRQDGPEIAEDSPFKRFSPLFRRRVCIHFNRRV